MLPITMSSMVGVKVRAYLLDGGDLGNVHAPPPVVAGDVIALSVGPPLKVVAVVGDHDQPSSVKVRPVYVDARSLHHS
jgi:hypothetical protein